MFSSHSTVHSVLGGWIDSLQVFLLQQPGKDQVPARVVSGESRELGEFRGNQENSGESGEFRGNQDTLKGICINWGDIRRNVIKPIILID